MSVSRVTQDTIVRSSNYDILEELTKKYKETQAESNNPAEDYLLPTKATLFGLDVRFRPIDRKLVEDKFALHKQKNKNSSE